MPGDRICCRLVSRTCWLLARSEHAEFWRFGHRSWSNCGCGRKSDELFLKKINIKATHFAFEPHSSDLIVTNKVLYELLLTVDALLKSAAASLISSAASELQIGVDKVLRIDEIFENVRQRRFQLIETVIGGGEFENKNFCHNSEVHFWSCRCWFRCWSNLLEIFLRWNFFCILGSWLCFTESQRSYLYSRRTLFSTSHGLSFPERNKKSS